MIEGEEIFESAQETGYRLCKALDDDTGRREVVFSATWDLNNPTRMLVCLANGQLKAFDIEDKSCDRYKVLFRRYTANFDVDPRSERLIEQHWDKMTTIPDRPDELIFLLGISRTLMYTALPPPSHNPYPEQPLLASTSRGDIPGFIFGSPIMEISSHNSRITALSVSPAGHILASGDEVGNVKLLLLRLLDEISVFKQSERRRKNQQSATTFSKFLPSYNVSFQAHDGPVFCLQWLPIITSSESSNVRNYALVTGSVDRTVRIWRVTCSSSTGIVATPAMNLDTLTTHVLSLNSYLYTDRYLLAKISRLESMALSNPSTPDRTSGGFRFTFAGVDTNNPSNAAKSDKAENSALGAKSIFLAAGTSVGMVYVWKVNYTDLVAILNSPAKQASGVAVPDDGSRLYALLQTSERPVINVALAAFPFSEANLSPLSTPSRGGSNSGAGASSLAGLASASAGDIVLAASDTACTVHIFTPERAQVNNNTLSPKDPAAAIAPGTTAGSEHTTLLRVGEQTFASPVVCCSFPPAYPNLDLDVAAPLTPSNRSVSSAMAAKVGRWDPTSMVQMNRPLLLAAAHGELMLYTTEDLSALSHERQRNLSGEFTLADSPHRHRTASATSGARDSDSVDSVDSQVVTADRLLSRKNSMRKQQVDAAREQSERQAAGEEDADSTSTPEQWEALQVRKTVRLAPPSPPPPPPRSQVTRVSAPREDVSVSECPRSAPPPAPTPATALVRPANTGGAVARRPNTRIPTAPLLHQRSASPTMTETDADTHATSSAPTSPSLPSPPQHIKERMAANKQRKQEESQAEDEPRANPFAQPTATYSKVWAARVDKLAKEIEQDEISVSTLQTTQSDRLAAARAAALSVPRRGRYGALTPSYHLDEFDLEALMAGAGLAGTAGRKKIPKQVDPDWLSRRKYGGPTEDDLRALCVPDPVVSLHLAYPPAAPVGPGAGDTRVASKAMHEHAYNAAFGLRQVSDGALLQSKYRLDVNVEQVFGRPDAEDDATVLGESIFQDFERSSLLSLVTHNPVL